MAPQKIEANRVLVIPPDRRLEMVDHEISPVPFDEQTVNTELKLKLEAISRAHSDLQNLMAATDISPLFLDAGLHIKRFTDRVADLFSVTPADEGRLITDFANQLDYPDLIKDARAVLADPARAAEPWRPMVRHAAAALSNRREQDRRRGHHVCRHHRAPQGRVLLQERERELRELRGR